MSTHDVPGANPANRDRLAGGAWAEHDDGSLILVHQIEAGTVVYSIYDLSREPYVEYTDSMAETTFKTRFSWRPEDHDDDDLIWTWHDQTPFPFDRVFENFTPQTRSVSAIATMTAAERVAESLQLQAQRVRQRQQHQPLPQRAATAIMGGIQEAIRRLKP